MSGVNHFTSSRAVQLVRQYCCAILVPHRSLTAYQERADVSRRQPSQRNGRGAKPAMAIWPKGQNLSPQPIPVLLAVSDARSKS